MTSIYLDNLSISGVFGNPVRIVNMAKVQKDMHEITIRNGNKAFNTKEAMIANNKMKPSDKPQLLKRLDSSNNSSSSFVSKTSISFKDRINSHSSSSPNTSTAKLCYTIPKRSSSNPNMVKDADSQFQSRVPNLEKETPGSGKKIPEFSRPKSNNKSKANDPEKKSSPVNNKPYSSRQPSQGDSLGRSNIFNYAYSNTCDLPIILRGLIIAHHFQPLYYLFNS